MAFPGERHPLMPRPTVNVGDTGWRPRQVFAKLTGDQGVADHPAERLVGREVTFGES